MYRYVGHRFLSMEISVPRNGITVVRLMAIASGKRAAVTRDGVESLEYDDADERLVVAVCVCSRHDVVVGDRGGKVSKGGEVYSAVIKMYRFAATAMTVEKRSQLHTYWPSRSVT